MHSPKIPSFHRDPCNLILLFLLHLLKVSHLMHTNTHYKKRGVTEHPRGAIFYCFRGNSMGFHGNSKILLPWGVPIHRVFYSAVMLHVHWTYISTLDMAMSSLPLPSSLHTLISMSSLAGDGSSLWNHGGLLKEQQVLFEPHPAPSHSGSSP